MTNARAEDPGWRSVLTRLPLLFVPVIGMRLMARNTSGLLAMRSLWAQFFGGSTIIWIPVVVVAGTSNGGRGDMGALGATMVVGVALQLIGAKLTRELDFSSEVDFVRSFQNRMLRGVAFSQPALLVGFVGFLITDSILVHAVGYVVAMAGMWDAAPRSTRLVEAQRQADQAGTGIDVIAALDGRRLTR